MHADEGAIKVPSIASAARPRRDEVHFLGSALGSPVSVEVVQRVSCQCRRTCHAIVSTNIQRYCVRVR